MRVLLQDGLRIDGTLSWLSVTDQESLSLQLQTATSLQGPLAVLLTAYGRAILTFPTLEGAPSKELLSRAIDKLIAFEAGVYDPLGLRVEPDREVDANPESERQARLPLFHPELVADEDLKRETDFASNRSPVCPSHSGASYRVGLFRTLFEHSGASQMVRDFFAHLLEEQPRQVQALRRVLSDTQVATVSTIYRHWFHSGAQASTEAVRRVTRDTLLSFAENLDFARQTAPSPFSEPRD